MQLHNPILTNQNLTETFSDFSLEQVLSKIHEAEDKNDFKLTDRIEAAKEYFANRIFDELIRLGYDHTESFQNHVFRKGTTFFVYRNHDDFYAVELLSSKRSHLNIVDSVRGDFTKRYDLGKRSIKGIISGLYLGAFLYLCSNIPPFLNLERAFGTGYSAIVIPLAGILGGALYYGYLNNIYNKKEALLNQGAIRNFKRNLLALHLFS